MIEAGGPDGPHLLLPRVEPVMDDYKSTPDPRHVLSTQRAAR